MFCENVVVEAAAWAVVLDEMGRNKKRRKKPRKKTRYKHMDKSATPKIISFVTPPSKSLEDLSYSALNLSTPCTIRIFFIFSFFGVEVGVGESIEIAPLV
jgi:hypothetical protein